jgi:hypothetical protein
MQQPQYNDLMTALNPMIRQLDRLEKRVENIVTRGDLEALRKELVAKDSFEPQLNGLKTQITRVDHDRIEDKKDATKRMDAMEKEQITRQDRLWMRLGPAAGVAGLILALFEALSHLKFIP